MKNGHALQSAEDSVSSPVCSGCEAAVSQRIPLLDCIAERARLAEQL